MKLMMTGKDGAERAGVMIPIPQYPLYTATIAEYNAYPVSDLKWFNSCHFVLSYIVLQFSLPSLKGYVHIPVY